MSDINPEQNQEEDVETTTNVEETSTETNQSEENENLASSSGEDNKAQAGESESNSSTDSGIEEPKSATQLQESRKTLWDQAREQAIQIESQVQNPTIRRQLDELGLTPADLKTNRLEQEMLWDKAKAKYPELETDEGLDQLVYGNYVARKNAGENVTPLQIAGEVTKYLEKKLSTVKEATYKQAEDDISAKTLVSPKNPKRSPGKGETNMSDLRARARAGDNRAIDDLIKATA